MSACRSSTISATVWAYLDRKSRPSIASSIRRQAEPSARDSAPGPAETTRSDRFHTPIIFITGFGDTTTTVQAMKAGAVEFLTKPFDDAALLSAIRQAIARSEVALVREAEMNELRERQESLSRREREVMALVVTGPLNKQIGGELAISEITVKAHRGKVMQKMKARSLADLLALNAKLAEQR